MPKEPYMLAAASAAVAWSGPAVTVSTESVERRDQLALVRLLTDDSEPNAEMRAMAEDYRRAVAEGRVSSSR